MIVFIIHDVGPAEVHLTDVCGPSCEDIDADRDHKWRAIRNSWFGIARHGDETRRHDQSSKPKLKMQTA